jgi:RNA polymerase sigma-70 factor (ECF subfamily)
VDKASAAGADPTSTLHEVDAGAWMATDCGTPWALDPHGPVGRGQVQAAQAGDRAAFTELYRELQPRLLRYATVLVGQDAEDVTAQAWLQIARDLARFRGDLDGFRGWCATIVRHRALDHVRARDRHPATPMSDAVLDRAGCDDTAATALEHLSTTTAIALIATLPPDQAQAVVLRAVLGLDAATAGQVLGKRAGAVRVAAHRGLRTLAQRLTELKPEPGVPDHGVTVVVDTTLEGLS